MTKSYIGQEEKERTMKYISKKKLKRVLEATIRNCDLITSHTNSTFSQSYYRGQKKVCEELLERLCHE